MNLFSGSREPSSNQDSENDFFLRVQGTIIYTRFGKWVFYPGAENPHLNKIRKCMFILGLK